MNQNTRLPPIPAAARSSAQNFLSEHQFLEQEVSRLTRENQQLTVQRDVYAVTCAEQVEKITALEAALRRVSRYGEKLITRLDVVDEAIGAARQAATEFAYKDVPPEPKTQQMTEAEVDKAIDRTTQRTPLPDSAGLKRPE